jgi:hypothetical protein
MTTKKQTSGINQALVQFHSTVPTIPMNGVNPFHRSKYARLEDILKVINKPLTDAGLVIIHRPEGINTMTTEIRHANSGETITTTYELIINGITKRDGTVEPPGPQQWSSAITYAKRVSISCLLNLCLDSDDDAEAAQNRSDKQYTYSKTARAATAQPEKQSAPQQQSAPQKPAQQDPDNKPWLNKGKDLDDIKKAILERRMGMSEVYNEFKVSKATRSELQALVNQADQEAINEANDQQNRSDDGLDHF